MKMTSGRMSCRVKTVIAVVLLLCFFIDYVKGGCLSYGHSCWGGHGKRSGPPGRPLPRSIPEPPAAAPDVWTAIERIKPPASKGALYAIPSNAYYHPLGRLLQIPPAAMLDLLGSNSGSALAASSENDVDSSKLDDDDGGPDSGVKDRDTLRDDQLRLREHRRKTLYESAPAETGTSNEDDFGQLLLDTTGTENGGNNLLKLLNPAPHRKYDQSA